MPDDATTIEYLRARIRKHRSVIVALKTVLEGVNIRGRAGGQGASGAAPKVRNDTVGNARYNAILRCRAILDDWANDCGGESD